MLLDYNIKYGLLNRMVIRSLQWSVLLYPILEVSIENEVMFVKDLLIAWNWSKPAKEN